jgi:hypothetical protein
MNMVVPPRRGPQCLPTLELEELAALGRSAPHVDGCESCRAYVEALKTESSAYVKARPFELLEKKLAQRKPAQSPSFWLRFLAPVAVVAAALVIGVVTLPETLGIRPKGSAFSVLLYRTTGATTIGDDTPVSAGDRLKLSFTAPENGYLLVLDLDGRERVTVAHPFGGAASAPVTAGPHVFDGSLELDDAPGSEWLIAVFSPEAQDAAPLIAQLKGQSTRASMSVSCERCSVHAVRLKKR